MTDPQGGFTFYTNGVNADFAEGSFVLHMMRNRKGVVSGTLFYFRYNRYRYNKTFLTDPVESQKNQSCLPDTCERKSF